MLKLTDRQRVVLVQTIPPLANLAVGTLVFGQFLRRQPFSIALALAGIGIWVVLVSTALVVTEGKR